MTPELRAACEDALHVFTTDGEVLRGAAAVLFVYDQLGYPAARVGRPLAPLLEPAYRLVSRNRRFFARFFFRTERGPGWRGHDPTPRR